MLSLTIDLKKYYVEEMKKVICFLLLMVVENCEH